MHLAGGPPMITKNYNRIIIWRILYKVHTPQVISSMLYYNNNFFTHLGIK